MRILVTGSRDWTDAGTVAFALHDAGIEADPDVTVVHGGARGADTLAGYAALMLGWPTEVHRADWKHVGRRAGILRNLQMIRAGADVCLAFIVNDSPGASHCALAAAHAGIPVRTYRG